MKRSLILILALFSSAVVTSCATTQPDPAGLQLMSEKEYAKVLDHSTRRIQKYSGLYNTVEMAATYLRPEMMQAQLEQSARLYQWDKARFSLEKNRRDELMKNETEFFLSFYTPDKKNDDLHKNNTQWRVYLDADGRRWEAKVTKIKLQLAEVQGLYPYHNRFSTAYSLTFPVSVGTLSLKPVKLVVTGPVDIATLEWQ